MSPSLNQDQVGFFFTNGAGAVNGAGRIGATLPRGSTWGTDTSTSDGAVAGFLAGGFLVVMPHYGRVAPIAPDLYAGPESQHNFTQPS